jgi:HK97 family phage major capsid protein
VVTRWSPNTLERGSEEWKRRQDIESGTTTKSSFAYEIHEAMDMGDGSILVTKWRGLEVSTVSIPADNSVGHAPVRSLAVDSPIISGTVPDEPIAQAMTVAPTTTEDATLSGAAMERERITGIHGLCSVHQMPESLRDELVNSGRTLDEARAVVLEKIGKRSRELQPGGMHMEADSMIGMDQRDLCQYSIVKLFRALSEPGNRQAREAAGFEFEISREACRKLDKTTSGAIIPPDWLYAKRDQTVGNFSKGGALVGTELLVGSFIDLLRNRAALMQSGITMIGGLVGNIDIPRKTAASQHYWVGEDVPVSESDVTFGLISGSPKTIGVRVPVSRRSLNQTTPDIDTIVRGDMAESIALGIDSSGLYGTGTNAQPLGLFNVTGIGSVTMAGGASMVYPAGLGGGTHDTGDWADYVNLRAGAYAGNVDVTNGRYIMNGVTMAGCEQTLRASAAGSDFIVNDQGNIGRYPVLMSNQLQTNDVAFGDFSDMILAMWGGLDIIVDNLTQAAKGQVIFTVNQDIDYICRRPASFSRGT